MSNTELQSLMNEVAPLVIHEMIQSKLADEFVANESMRFEIIEICFSEVARKWEKFAVMVRTNPAITREILNLVAA